MATNYVKFFRGTIDTFNTIVKKDSDTLYFITNKDDSISLYLGEKTIASNISNLSNLEDVILTELKDKHVLTYNEVEQKWFNQSVNDIIGLMTGATVAAQGSAGLVPAPGIGQQNAFLRGDGTWAEIEIPNQVNVDGNSINILEDGITITLNGFGKKFYKLIPATETIAAHYEIQEVDANNPWKEGLEPRVISENGELVLGWFEPNTSTIEGVNNSISAIQSEIKEIKTIIGTPGTEDLPASGLYAKADADKVYTKEETLEVVQHEIAKYEHLTRKTFETFSDALIFASEVENPESYIYMVKAFETAENDNYDEYLYIDGILEKVGSWEVDLSDYATKEDLKSKVDVKIGYDLISNIDLAKLSAIEENAQKNIINSVDEIEFSNINGHLSINNIAISKINNLEAILNKKADKSDTENINTEINSLNKSLNEVSTQVNDISEFLNSGYFIAREEFEQEIDVVKEAVTWREL